MRLLGLAGVVLALIGFGMLTAPEPTRAALKLLGVRVDAHPAGRVAAWGLVILGLAIAVVSRVAS
jgi:hypothetical protein